MQKILKKIVRWFLGIVFVLAIIVVSLIAPIDDSPLAEHEFYKHTIQGLDTFNPIIHPPRSMGNGILNKKRLLETSIGLKAAWASINITPKSSMPMAGYAPRNHFDSVHDSVFIRILGLNNGSVRCFFISADLLLFPPALKNKIMQLNRGNDFLYFTATHAHSSLGAWDNSAIGNLILGKYNAEWIDILAQRINSTIGKISEEMKPSVVEYFEADADEFVENRLDPEHGKTDGKLRGLKIYRDDGSKGLFVSYSAHPTNISHLSLELSGDYPNALVRKAEEKDFDFAMFAGGMVGSHRVKGIKEKEFALCDTLSSKLYEKIFSAAPVNVGDTISTGSISIEYGPSQLHVLQNYKIRDWAFRWLFKPLNGNITYLKIGNILFLGTPCDFSGEIFVNDGLGKLAESQNEKLFITSFNGDYVGYITYDEHYGHSEQEEIMAMNWVGPYFGNYYSQIVKKIIEKGH